MKINYWLLFILCVTAEASVESHLRKCPNKSSAYSMKGIDFIYLINLDERPEKLKSSLDQLTQFQIHPYRFSAVNGWKLSLEEINDVGLVYSCEMQGGILATCYPLDGSFQPVHERISEYGKTYFSHCLARGPIGIALSHISILQDAYDCGYETIWVMEDDIWVLQDPRILPHLIEKLDHLTGKNGWDILFTDRDMRDRNGNYTTTYWAGFRPDYKSENDFAMKVPFGDDFYRVGARSGAHSMILRRSGIKKILQFFHAHQIFFPYDMEYILPQGIQLFTLKEDLITNIPKALSDNGAPNYLNRETP